MSTKALIDRIAPFAKGYNRTGSNSIARIIQQGQDLLYEQEANFSIWQGTENKGFAPYLKTVAGQFRYEMIPANFSNLTDIVQTIGGVDYSVRVKRVLKVFVDLSQTSYTKQFVGQPFIFFYTNPYNVTSTRIQGGILPVDQWPALETTNAYIDFKEDPATTTNTYFVQFSYEPPRLTSEQIPLLVPLSFEEALRDYAVGEIQMLANGKPNEFQTKFWNFWVPKWKQYMSGGASSDNLEVQPLIC